MPCNIIFNASNELNISRSYKNNTDQVIPKIEQPTN